MSAELTEFVRRAIEAKIGREEIARAIAAAGWPEAEAKAALAAFAEVPFPLAVPRPRPHLSARDVFTYLVLFGALYASVWYVVELLFRIIDKVIPDTSSSAGIYGGPYADQSIHWSIAGLVVSFPLFLYTFRVVNRRIGRDPTARNSGPRKWLTYLTLALAVSTLAGDLATLVYEGLEGALTTPLVLKALVVAIAAGGTFVYFFTDIRQGEDA